jgi:hypothetical protein
MLVNPHLKQIHPYYYKRIREAPFNAAVVLVCGILGLIILTIATFIK